jgi:hypothetical protein
LAATISQKSPEDVSLVQWGGLGSSLIQLENIND